MRSERVLVVGATGMLGEPVARRLLADGWRVRCLVRSVQAARSQLGDDFEYVLGDVTQAGTLDAAFDQCAYLHLNLRGTNTIESYELNEVQGSATCIRAAHRHGLRRITYLSGAGRIQADTQGYFPIRVKLAVEASLAAGRIPWTVFRATHFMESLNLCIRNGRAAILGRQPHRLHYLAAADYAGMAARALDLSAAQNRALYLFGPHAWTMKEALQRYVHALRPDLRLQTLPLPAARFIARVTGNQDLRFAADLFSAFAAIGEEGDPSEAIRLLGAPTTDLAQWLEECRHLKGQGA